MNILFQDNHILVVEKPPLMLVHPWKKFLKDEPDLMNAVKEKTGLYLYPVHRLDRQVSGLVIFGLSKEATKNLKENWHNEDFQKIYLTLCRGHMESSGQFDFDLKVDKKKNIWKSALTLFRPLIYFNSFSCSLVEVQIKTGRKHQIRKHFSRRFFNIIGDSKYGTGPINIQFREMGLKRIFLHAYKLKFKHPITEEMMSFRCPLPKDLTDIISQIGPQDINQWLAAKEEKRGEHPLT